MSNSGKIWDVKEVYTLQRGNQWITGNGSKALTGGGGTPSASNTIETLNIAITGNASDFGDLTQTASEAQAGSSAINAFFAEGGISEKKSFATQGNASSFVSLGITPRTYGAAGNNTRALFMGNGAPAFANTVEYIETAGNGFKADFGNLSTGSDRGGACSSPTRTLFAGGEKSDGSNTNAIDFFTTATTGNATDFGDLTVANRYPGGTSSTTRGLYFNGYSNTRLQSIDTFELGSTGNATDFGDLSGVYIAAATMSNKIRAVHCGGTDGSLTNIIEFVTIAVKSNTTDFGDLTVAKSSFMGCSEGHGGLTMGALPRQSVTYMPGSGRGFTLGGYINPAKQDTIQLTNIPTKGNTSDFGNLLAAVYGGAGFGSLTRGFYAGDVTEGNVIESFEYASQGNAANFGDLTVGRQGPSGLSSVTRGVVSGGEDADISSPARANTIDYVTMATAGNATDFGDLVLARSYSASAGSSVRGIIAGGDVHPSAKNEMDYITIASTSNATDFGNLSVARNLLAGVSSSTRAVFGGGNSLSSPYYLNTIDYVTIASTGDASDFGDLTVARATLAGFGNSTSGIFTGGTSPDVNTMDFITIASTGDAADFGDLISAIQYVQGCSDSHGGLQA